MTAPAVVGTNDGRQMKIHFPGGHIRQALNTFEDAEFLAHCMADWPTGGWNLNRALAHVAKPVIDPDKDFHAVLIFCDPWPAGACGVRHIKGPPSGFQVNFLAMHPDSRKQGKGSKFKDALAWFANQYLRCDSGRFQVEVPEVEHWTDVLRGTISDNMAYLTIEETAKAVKEGYTVEL
jgi:hypothetical protein